MSAQNDGLQRWQNTNIDVLKHQKAICFLVAGVPLDETAKELGISTRTLERWFKHPEFNQNLALAIKHVYVSSFAKAVGYVDESMSVLMQIIKDENTPTRNRIDAIKLLLDFTAKGYQEIFKNQSHTEENQISSSIKKELRVLNEGLLLNQTAQGYPRQVAEEIIDKSSRKVWAELYPDEPYPKEEDRLLSVEMRERVAAEIGRRRFEAEQQALNPGEKPETESEREP
ncbi:MAG: hypothetical protein KME38_25070 [Spirirestis rafaelensis WJT71-NPBG6]|jgi:hypothetical protein|nr:hypothetical protein [Spirirestis rafaelensis WJT71-NPBG6]